MGIKPERVIYIEEEIAYWRKANAIHAWFVENCQDGRDECQTAYVSRDQLEDLLLAVNAVLDGAVTVPGDVHNGTSWEGDGKHEHYEPGEVILNQEMADELLPTRSGFFFGGTDYDHYYLEGLRYTKERLEGLLKEDNLGELYYHASW